MFPTEIICVNYKLKNLGTYFLRVDRAAIQHGHVVDVIIAVLERMRLEPEGIEVELDAVAARSADAPRAQHGGGVVLGPVRRGEVSGRGRQASVTRPVCAQS